MLSDWALLDRYAKDGNQQAFAELVERHVNVVYGAARRILGGPGKGEQDVVQAVFLLLSERAGRIKRQTAMAAWLFRATDYCCRNVKKEEMRREKREREVAMGRPEAAVVDGAGG